MKVGLGVTNRGAAAIAEIRLQSRPPADKSPVTETPTPSSGLKPIGMILPQVLSRYGLTRISPLPNEIDLWA